MKREEAEAIYDLGKEAVVEILLKMDARITALETRLGLNSSNSSKPPSTDSPFVFKPKTTSNAKRKAGGQKGHAGKNLKMVEHPDGVIVKSAHVYHTVNQKEVRKRGRVKQTFAKNLLDRLIKYKDETLRFVTDFNVPFTNNAAERGLRMMKVKEKISGCFMSQKGGRIFMNIYAYILTVKKNGVNIMQALLDAMRGKPFIPLVCKFPPF